MPDRYPSRQRDADRRTRLRDDAHPHSSRGRLRTFTPTQAVIAEVPASITGPRRAAGCTTSPPACSSPTSGTTRRRGCSASASYMGWPTSGLRNTGRATSLLALPMTAYNAVTPVEVEATRRLLKLLCRMHPAASGWSR